MQWLWAGSYEPAFDSIYRLFPRAGADRTGTNVATWRGLIMVAIALSLLAAIGLAGGAVSARGAMPGVHTFTTISVSLVVGFVGVLIAALAFAWSDFREIPREVWPWILALGLVHFVAGRSLGYLGVNTIGASRTALFISAQAPFAAFFAIAFAGEELSPLIAVGTVGVVAALLLYSGDSLTEGWRTDRRYLLGCLASLGAGASMGGSSVLAKQTIAVYGSPLVVTVLSMIVAMLVIVPAIGTAAARSPAVRTFDRRSMGLVCISGLSVAMAIVAQFFAVQRADVVVVAPIIATFPLWTLMLSHIFIVGLEGITLRLVIGAFLAVGGVIAVALGGQL